MALLATLVLLVVLLLLLHLLLRGLAFSSSFITSFLVRLAFSCVLALALLLLLVFSCLLLLRFLVSLAFLLRSLGSRACGEHFGGHFFTCFLLSCDAVSQIFTDYNARFVSLVIVDSDVGIFN